MLEQINYNIQKNAGDSWLTKTLLNIAYDTTLTSQSGFPYDSDGNFYLYVTQNVNYTDAYLVSFDKNGIFRWCKMLKDTGISLNAKISVYDVFVDEVNRIHCYGNKNNSSINSNDSDAFCVIFNQDGTVYKNLGYTDNPSVNYITSYGGCLTKDYSVLFGVKWSTTYQSRPQFFILDKLGNLQKSLWANVNSPVSRLFDGCSIPNTNQVILLDDETHNSSGNPRFINYDIATNVIKWNFSFNTFVRRNAVGSQCSRILFDSDNNIYIIGYLKSNKNLIHIIKINQARQILWSKSYYETGFLSSCNAIQGCNIFNNEIYVSCYCVNNNVKYIIKIDCELGDITKQWKNINNASYGLNYLTSYNNSLYNMSRSTDNTLLLSKLSFSDLDYYSNIELKDYYNLIEGHEYISSDITSTITNYSDISFSNASYLTSTQLNISNITLNSQEKLEAVYS